MYGMAILLKQVKLRSAALGHFAVEGLRVRAGDEKGCGCRQRGRLGRSGGALGQRLPAKLLRTLVIAVGSGMTLYYFWATYFAA